MGLLSKNIRRDDIWSPWTSYPMAMGEFRGIKYLVQVLGYYAANPTGHYGLPVEFFNHELTDLDIANDEQIANFCSQWGPVFCPFLGSPARFDESKTRFESNELLEEAITNQIKDKEGPREKICKKLVESKMIEFELKRNPEYFHARFQKEIEKEASLNLLSRKEIDAVAKSAYLQTQLFEEDLAGKFEGTGTYPGKIISLDEVRCVLEMMQSIAQVFPMLDSQSSTQEVIAALETIANTPEGRCPEISRKVSSIRLQSKAGANDEEILESQVKELNSWLDIALCYFNECLWPLHKKALRTDDEDLSRRTDSTIGLSLQNAICMQLYFELDDENEWHECAYPKCNRIFKYQRYSSTPLYYPKGLHGGALYCCKKHTTYANRQYARNLRKVAFALAGNGCTRDRVCSILRTEFDGIPQTRIDDLLDEIFN